MAIRHRRSSRAHGETSQSRMSTQDQAKALKKLKRSELLEIMYKQAQKIESLESQLAEMRRQLHDKQVTIANSRSIAEAAMRINRVFEDAQAAADQYLANIRANAGEAAEAHTLSDIFAGDDKARRDERERVDAAFDEEDYDSEALSRYLEQYRNQYQPQSSRADSTQAQDPANGRYRGLHAADSDDDAWSGR